jgi:hypothetical protein
MLALLLLACTQAADLESLIGKLGSEDPAIREKSVEELIALGPKVVPRILSLYRSTDSAETKLRAEQILCRFPFPAYVLGRPDEPQQEKLRDILLRGIENHRDHRGCWQEPEHRPKIDASRLIVLRQGGSGHGQTLELDYLSPRKDGGLVLRRIAYEQPTPYRPKVREERTRVEETVLDEAESRALTSLLEAASGLRPVCAREEERTGWMSTANFSMRFRILSGDKPAWEGGYTGYPDSSAEKLYAHGLILDRALHLAWTQRTWTPATMTPEDLRRVLAWIEANFEREGWWVRERYLRIAATAGDESFLPFLRRAAETLQGKEGPSEIRQSTSVKEALRRIAGTKD